MQKPRIQKKLLKIESDLEIYLEWWNDFRLFLMEAIEDGSSIQVLRRQFKERYTRGMGCKSTRWFKSSRMDHEFRDCMGDAYGREGLR